MLDLLGFPFGLALLAARLGVTAMLEGIRLPG
jgi:hypothetical protein